MATNDMTTQPNINNKELTLKDLEEVYKTITEPLAVVEKIKVTPAYFTRLKKDLPSTEINPIYGIPVVVDPELKVPFKICYKRV